MFGFLFLSEEWIMMHSKSAHDCLILSFDAMETFGGEESTSTRREIHTTSTRFAKNQDIGKICWLGNRLEEWSTSSRLEMMCAGGSGNWKRSAVSFKKWERMSGVNSHTLSFLLQTAKRVRENTCRWIWNGYWAMASDLCGDVFHEFACLAAKSILTWDFTTLWRNSCTDSRFCFCKFIPKQFQINP